MRCSNWIKGVPCAVGLALSLYASPALAIFDTEAEAKEQCFAWIKNFFGSWKCDSVLTPKFEDATWKYQVGYWRAYPSDGYPHDGTSWSWWVYSIVTTPPARKVVLVLDPGHGLNCAAIGQPPGALGVTNFPASNPPAGRLREDDLTLTIALQAEQMLAPKYKVILTKRDLQSCPTLIARGRIANNANAKLFVSIHINAANFSVGPIVNPFGNGTSTYYNAGKFGSSKLADEMARSVSQALGVNNRGAFVDVEKAVIKPKVTEMNAVLLEAARLSGDDEQKLHASGSAARIAVGIKTAVEANLAP